jgi:hypothetical protein
MFQQGELLDINTDSIFSDHDFNGDWRLEEKEEKLPPRLSYAQTA